MTASATIKIPDGMTFPTSKELAAGQAASEKAMASLPDEDLIAIELGMASVLGFLNAEDREPPKGK